jgi:hypothetical protein
MHDPTLMLRVLVLFLYNVAPHIIARRDAHGALALHYVCQRKEEQAGHFVRVLMHLHPASRYAQVLLPPKP